MNPAKQLWGILFGLAISGAALGGNDPAADNAPASPAAWTAAGEHEPSGSKGVPPSRQYASAYDSMAQADWLKKQGMSEEAYALYSEATALFQQLAAEHPLWETNVVAFRIRYCTNELVRLRPAAPPAAVSIPQPVAAASPAAPSPVPAAPGAPERLAAPARPVIPDKPVDIARLTARLQMALQNERAFDLQDALENYLTVLEEQPRNGEAIKGAARCFLRAGLPGDARNVLQRGMSLPDPDAEMNLLMALVYCCDKEFYKAYQLLIIALNEQPENAIAHLALGVAQAGLEQFDNARVATQKAIQLDPKLGDAYYNLARISLKLKPLSPVLAREYYLNALRYGAAPDPALTKQLQ